MNYRVRPGVVLTKICGVYLLIPTRAAAEHCPQIIRLSIPLLILWQGIDKGMPFERFSPIFQEMMRKSESEADEVVDRCVQKLVEGGYLIAEEEG